MEALKKEVYTVNDIYTLPDGIRADLINGQMYYIILLSRTHQKLLHFI